MDFVPVTGPLKEYVRLPETRSVTSWKTFSKFSVIILDIFNGHINILTKFRAPHRHALSVVSRLFRLPIEVLEFDNIYTVIPQNTFPAYMKIDINFGVFPAGRQFPPSISVARNVRACIGEVRDSLWKAVLKKTVQISNRRVIEIVHNILTDII